MQENTEIERQFMLNRPAAEIIAAAAKDGTLLMSYDIHQSYLPDTGVWTIRARKTIFDAPLAPCYEETLKRTIGGITRREIKLNLTAESYAKLTSECGPVLRKRRTELCIGDRIWEIDVFLNPSLEKLELVEVELPSEDAGLVLPEWIGKETTYLHQYRNAELAKRITADEDDQ